MSGPATWSSGSTSATSPGAGSGSSPVARGAASTSPPAWSARRRCCSSTNRPPGSTRPPEPRCGTSSTSSPRPGTTVVLTTQYLDEADRLADDIVVLDHGRVAARGTPAELKRLVGGKVVTATIPAAETDRLPARPRDAASGRTRPRHRHLQRRDADAASDLVAHLGPGRDHRRRPRGHLAEPRRRLHPPHPDRSPIMTTTSITARPAPVPVGDQLAALVARNLRTTARVPQLLMFSLTMPMAMLVLFSQVFRSVADGPDFPAGVSYIDFLTPAMLAVTTVMAGTNAGVAAAIDHTNGLHDRFATLPMPRAAPRPGPHDQRDRVRHRPSHHPARRRRPARVPVPRRRRRRGGRPGRARRPRRRDERPVRTHRRPAAPTRRRPVRRDDGDDAVHVHLQRLRTAGHHARLDAHPRRVQPGRPRRRRATRQRARHRQPGRHGHRPRRRRDPVDRRHGPPRVDSPPPGRGAGARPGLSPAIDRRSVVTRRYLAACVHRVRSGSARTMVRARRVLVRALRPGTARSRSGRASPTGRTKSASRSRRIRRRSSSPRSCSSAVNSQRRASSAQQNRASALMRSSSTSRSSRTPRRPSPQRACDAR